MSISIPYCFNLWYCLIYSNTLILTSLESYVQWNWLARTNVVFWVDWNVMWQREKWIIFTVRAKPEEFLRIIGNKGTVRTAINFCRTEKNFEVKKDEREKDQTYPNNPLALTTCDRLGLSVGGWTVGEDGKGKISSWKLRWIKWRDRK